MPITLYCPACGTALNVREDAPTHLTCPVCVAPLVNPMSRAPLPVLPVLPVAPVDREASRDARAVRHLMIFVVVLLIAAALLTALTLGAGNAIFHVLIMMLVAAFVCIGIYEGGERDAMTLRAEAEAADAIRAAQEQDLPHAGSGAGRTLDYRRPRAYPRGREPMGSGAVAGGLFASLGVCATGFFILLGSLDLPREQHANILLGVVLMVLAFVFVAPYFATRRGWRGFGLGATIGLVLGMLALGPCAFCYTMTI